MARHQKVVWYEGMTLDPHHFQQADRFHQTALSSRLRALARFDWGFLTLQVDKQALANGLFGLLNCKGVTPDGLMFDMPASDPLPRARTIADQFPATAEKLEVYLAIRTERAIGSNCQLSGPVGSNDSRFAFEESEVVDDNTGVDPRRIGLARANFQLRFGLEPLEDFSVLKLAVIEKKTGGIFSLSPSFIPPCLSLAASENLMSLTNNVLADLVAKSTNQRGLVQRGGNEFNAADANNLAILQTVNHFIPLVNHHYSLTKCHPEELYATLLALTGQLTTFNLRSNIRPAELPPYDHDNLSTCFSRIQSQIHELLGAGGIIEKATPIPLQRQGESLHTGQITDEQLATQLFLRFSSDLPERKIIDELPVNLKIASSEEIYALVQAGMLGVSVSYVPRPPSGLSAQAGLHYFRIDKVGRFWEAICRSHTIAIFIAAEFTSLKPELISFKE